MKNKKRDKTEKTVTSAKQIKALVIDNEQKVLNFFIEISKELSMAVTTARAGRIAIKKVNEKPYQVVFLDDRMPRTNVLSTFRTIKKIRSDLPIFIMVDSVAENNVLSQLLKEGASGYFRKPLTVSQVVEIIRPFELMAQNLHKQTNKHY